MVKVVGGLGLEEEGDEGLKEAKGWEVIVRTAAVLVWMVEQSCNPREAQRDSLQL